MRPFPQAWLSHGQFLRTRGYSYCVNLSPYQCQHGASAFWLLKLNWQPVPGSWPKGSQGQVLNAADFSWCVGNTFTSTIISLLFHHYKSLPLRGAWARVGLPWWLSGKESACRYRRYGFNPWVRKISWRRKWQSTPVFLPGESHGQRSLVG